MASSAKLLRVFTFIVSLVPAVVALPILYIFEVTDLKIFMACGITFFDFKLEQTKCFS